MKQLIYTSTALIPHDQDEHIYVPARIKNARLDLCGCLHRSGDTFIQILEGDEDTVDGLMEDIERDPRHENVRVLFDTPIEQRTFQGWDMPYVKDDLNDDISLYLNDETRSDIDEADREAFVRFFCNSLIETHSEEDTNLFVMIRQAISS